MRKIIYLLAMVIANFVTEAQIKVPKPSPKSTLIQTVGLTNVEINYSRPSARGRDVFNNLVPFGKLWRTGANENTTISFSDNVVIDGKTLEKGKYALYTIPKADNWDVFFYKSTDNAGVPTDWEESKIALKTTIKSEHLDRKIETFTIEINNLDFESANIELYWEQTLITIKFDVPTDKRAIESIEKILSGPTADDYYAAANYYYQSNGDLKKALNYINKSIELKNNPPFWYNRLKSLIQAKLGDKTAAIETAKISLAAAEIAKNQDYIKLNKDSIAEWSKK